MSLRGESDRFKLSTTLIGHENDVKAVLFPQSDLILSASRDRTVRSWHRSPSSSWDSSILFTSEGYVNSLTYVQEDSNSSPFNLVVSGSQDSSITASNISHPGLEPEYFLLGHDSNVCSLDSKFGLIASGSWDKTARVWENGKLKFALKGHTQAVWAVAIVSPTLILTGSADQTIRLWENGVQIRVFEGHTDAVRGLALISESIFVSCSNDSSIRIWNLSESGPSNLLQELYGHTSYIYSVSVLPSGEILSTGEDRSARIWRDGQCVQVIILPCVSVWSGAVNASNGDIVLGGSDNQLRVFSRNLKRQAPEEELIKFQELVASSGIGKDQVGQINKEKLSGPEALLTAGEKEGQVLMIKTETGVVEAHQWSDEVWLKIGEVVGSTSTQDKKNFEGKDYDYIFDVDIEDGKPPLKLPYNVTENPYDAARKFLERNELPGSYLDNVANFITTNTEGVELASKPAEDPYGTRYIPGQDDSSASNKRGTVRSTKVVPVLQYIKLVSFQVDSIKKGLIKYNSLQDASASLSPQTVDDIVGSLARLSGADASTLLSNVVTISNTWKSETILPALDILRIIIPSLPSIPTAVILQLIFSSLDAGVPKHCLLAARAVVNLFASSQGISIVKSSQVRELTLSTLHEVVTNGSVQWGLVISSLLINYSILAYREHNVPQVLELLEHLTFFSGQFSDSESVYRFLLALGTLLSLNDKQVKKTAQKLELDKKVSQVTSEFKESRIAEVVEDINKLFND